MGCSHGLQTCVVWGAFLQHCHPPTCWLPHLSKSVCFHGVVFVQEWLLWIGRRHYMPGESNVDGDGRLHQKVLQLHAASCRGLPLLWDSHVLFRHSIVLVHEWVQASTLLRDDYLPSRQLQRYVLDDAEWVHQDHLCWDDSASGPLACDDCGLLSGCARSDVREWVVWHSSGSCLPSSSRRADCGRMDDCDGLSA